MIKAEELRIGNIIQSNFLSIEQITVFEIKEHWINDDSGLTYDILQGVNLTEEWLINFGFIYEKHETDYFIKHRYILGNFWVSREQWKKNMILDFEFLPHFDLDLLPGRILFVHQLQNLYFALIGKELTLC